jgi:hypothetical protein
VCVCVPGNLLWYQAMCTVCVGGGGNGLCCWLEGAHDWAISRSRCRGGCWQCQVVCTVCARWGTGVG